ncbi:MAG: NinB protein [Acidobacteria bacterium ADurb.Bin340]|nr:MAG: NinB protein [Acidobacteria bacterium ADurb.Bin340]
MTKLTFTMAPAPHPARQNAAKAVMEAPEGHIVTIAEPTRTQAQNRLLWPLLNLWAVHKQALINGASRHVTKEAWKVIHLSDFRHQHGIPGEMALTPGGILVPLGYETKTMPKGEFRDFLEYLLAETHQAGMQLEPRLAKGYLDWLEANPRKPEPLGRAS